MVGGVVVQVVYRRNKTFIEVLCPTHFNRQWRWLPGKVDVAEQDEVWWQSHTGYRSRVGHDPDKNIGPCRPANNPLTKETNHDRA